MGTGGSRYGAGRPGWHVKAEHCLRLDVRTLARHGVLRRTGYLGWHWTDGSTGEQRGAVDINVFPNKLRLNFSTGDRAVEQVIPLDHTPCHYGGTRPWFHCPRCGRRAGVLFLRSGLFLCRPCGRVVYGSQSDDGIGSSWRRQQRLEQCLGEGWTRPKGMHHRTHQRLMAGILECIESRDRAVAQYIANINSRLARLGKDWALEL